MRRTAALFFLLSGCGVPPSELDDTTDAIEISSGDERARSIVDAQRGAPGDILCAQGAPYIGHDLEPVEGECHEELGASAIAFVENEAAHWNYCDYVHSLRVQQLVRIEQRWQEVLEGSALLETTRSPQVRREIEEKIEQVMQRIETLKCILAWLDAHYRDHGCVGRESAAAPDAVCPGPARVEQPEPDLSYIEDEDRRADLLDGFRELRDALLASTVGCRCPQAAAENLAEKLAAFITDMVALFASCNDPTSDGWVGNGAAQLEDWGLPLSGIRCGEWRDFLDLALHHFLMRTPEAALCGSDVFVETSDYGIADHTWISLQICPPTGPVVHVDPWDDHSPAPGHSGTHQPENTKPGVYTRLKRQAAYWWRDEAGKHPSMDVCVARCIAYGRQLDMRRDFGPQTPYSDAEMVLLCENACKSP